MTTEDLNKSIKNGALSGIYFFYGEEQYLLKKKLEQIQKKIITEGTEPFNVFKFTGKDANAADILAAVDQFPQMSEMKLIIVKNSELLNNAVLSDFKRIKEAADHIPQDTCLIFVEQDFDKKKLKNLSFIEENGGIVNFEYIPQRKLEIWITDVFAKVEKSIYEKEVRYLLRLCGQSLGKISAECDKLINYTGDRRKITQEDIDAVVDKTVECRTYDMLDNMIAGRSDKALQQLNFLKNKHPKEKPHYILGLIMSRLSDLLMCKLLKEDGLSAAEISKYFDYPKPIFAVNKLIDESRRFGEKYLKRMIDKGLFYDLECKSGNLAPWTAVELYLIELSK